MQDASMIVTKSEADADVVIVNTVIQSVAKERNEGAEGRSSYPIHCPCRKIIRHPLLIPERKDCIENVTSNQQLQTALGIIGWLCQFHRAMTRCDGISALFRRGKKLAFTHVRDNIEM